MTDPGFASDNAAGVHPRVLAAVAEANTGYALGYGQDRHTAAAVDRFRERFGDDIEVLFTYGGTGANVVGLRSLVDSYQAVICAETAHLWRDSCSAPERFLGAKLMPVAAVDGKLEPERLRPLLSGDGSVHHAQPSVISISQPTEWGTVYRPEEIRAIADLAHERGLQLHMDGARLGNAAAALDVPLAAITAEVGVDVLSFGGTKLGLLAGDAIVLFDRDRSRVARFHQKQATQLPSKMRFIAAQFSALFDDELWRELAGHANAMARRLADRLSGAVELVAPVETNAIFARLPSDAIRVLRASYDFAVWDGATSVARWMTSFATLTNEVDRFADAVRRSVAASREEL